MSREREREKKKNLESRGKKIGPCLEEARGAFCCPLFGETAAAEGSVPALWSP